LALQFHPDKNSAPGSEEVFKVITKSFAVLSDPEKRRKYDLTGRDDDLPTIENNFFNNQQHFHGGGGGAFFAGFDGLNPDLDDFFIRMMQEQQRASGKWFCVALFPLINDLNNSM
jgi:DnaJ-class molecular chaperone